MGGDIGDLGVVVGQNGLRVAVGEDVERSGATAGAGGDARFDEDQVEPEPLNLLGDALLGSLSDGDEGDDGTDADDQPEQGQGAAEAVADDRANGDAERIEDAHAVVCSMPSVGPSVGGAPLSSVMRPSRIRIVRWA